MTNYQLVQPMARRAKFHDARRHFLAGGRVLVDEHGREPIIAVGSWTTTHQGGQAEWDELAAQVRMWRSRYPRQRFYIIDEPAGTPRWGSDTLSLDIPR